MNGTVNRLSPKHLRNLKCEILHIWQLSLIIGNSTDLQGINRAAVSGYKSICKLIYIQWKHKLLIFVDMDQMI